MLSATAFAIFFVPVFFVLVHQLFDRKKPKPEADPAPAVSETV